MDITELFQLCGFETDEIEQQRPRIDKAFQILGIGADDIERAEKRVRENFDIELQGVRKLLGVWMKEAVALALAREENRKVIYSEWPGATNILLMAARHAAKDVYFGSPGSQALNVVMGIIFDKLRPLLEAGEENGLPPGSAHCALWQTHIGAIVKGLIPIPDLMISSGWYCDQPAEADQLLHELYDIPTVYLDGCLDWQWDEWPELGRRQIEYTAKSMEKIKQRIEQEIGCEISPEAERAGLRDNAKLFYNFQTLVELVGRADPQPIRQNDLSLIYNMTYSILQNRDEANEAIVTLCKEVKGRVAQGKGVVPKGAPRIYFGLRVAVDPAILKMVEEIGLAMPICFLDWLIPAERQKTRSITFAEKIMEGLYRRGTLCGTSGHIEYMKEYCRTWNVDGAILCYPYSCRPYTIPPLMTKRSIMEELGIPVLVLEGDAYDTRNYSAGQLRTRVETFAEMLRMTKAAKAA
jgi:hypothetical protein